MEIKELYDKLSEQQFNLKKQMSSTAVHRPYIDQTKNMLYNNFDAIVDAIKFAAGASEQIKVLEVELADAENELTEKDSLIEELKGKKTTKKKIAGAENG